jgi:hypothetical protein
MPVGRPIGSVNSQKPFTAALRLELASADGDQRALRAIARNLIELAVGNGPNSLAAIREISDRLDGRPRQSTDVTVRTAPARELTDAELTTIALGADVEGRELEEAGPSPGKSELN